MPYPLAGINVTKVWHNGCKIEFVTQANATGYQVYVDGELFAKYPRGGYTENATTGLTSILVDGLPDKTTLSIRATVEKLGVEGDLSPTPPAPGLTVVPRTVLPIATAVAVQETKLFT